MSDSIRLYDRTLFIYVPFIVVLGIVGTCYDQYHRENHIFIKIDGVWYICLVVSGFISGTHAHHA